MTSREQIVPLFKVRRSSSDLSNNLSVPFNDMILFNLTISTSRIFHHDGVAYDFYSKDELNRSNASLQWKIWSLPIKTNEISPTFVSNLSFVHSIYVLSDPRLTERHNNLRRAFHRQGIEYQSIDWRMKWNRTTCNSESNRLYVYQRLNLKNKTLSNSISLHQIYHIVQIQVDQPISKAIVVTSPRILCLNICLYSSFLDEQQQKTCALAMKHVDVWHDMADKKIPLGLVLEDDVIFVPYFKEKFTRMIYAAIDQKILRIDGTCIKPREKPISNDETIHQNPMIVIGTCFNFHGLSFQENLSNATPVLTTHKSDPSRCTHAYLLTSCSAQALVDQIQAQKNDYQPSDFLQNHLFPSSPTLQSFWMDPPLAYQGNQVTDLDKLPTFASKTYQTLK